MFKLLPILLVLFLADSSFAAAKSGAGDPNGNAGCSTAGEIYLDTTTQVIWHCLTAGDKVWYSGGVGGVTSFVSPAVSPVAGDTTLDSVWPLFESRINDELIRVYDYSGLEPALNIGATGFIGDAAFVAACNAAGIESVAFVTDTSDCSGGGGGIGVLCQCKHNGAAYYTTPYIGTIQHWGYATLIADPGPFDYYFHSAIDWPDPWLRLGDVAPGDCSQMQFAGGGISSYFTVEAGMSYLALWQVAMSDNPVGATAEDEIQDSIVFYGFTDEDIVGSANILIDPAGVASADAAVIQANVVNGFGVLWHGPTQKFYSVWIRSNALTTRVMWDLTNASEFSNFVGQRRAILSSVMGNHQVGSGDNALKFGAYDHGLSIMRNAAWTPFAEALTTGAPAVGSDFVPFITVCSKTGGTNNAEAFLGRTKLIIGETGN
jgi:hypothetical protein